MRDCYPAVTGVEFANTASESAAQNANRVDVIEHVSFAVIHAASIAGFRWNVVFFFEN